MAVREYKELIEKARAIADISFIDKCWCCPETEEWPDCTSCIADTLRSLADAVENLSMKLHGDEAAIAGMKREIERMVVTASDGAPKPPKEGITDGT